MERKPDIQYVGQFYIHGSEARELARREQEKQARTRLPLERLQNIQKVYLDPVALVGIVVSVVMLVVMVIGAVQLRRAWTDCEQMSAQLTQLQRENDVLQHGYRSGYDLEDIRVKAIAMGMIPVEDAETIRIRVTMPVHEPEPTWWENVVWFLDGLIE